MRKNEAVNYLLEHRTYFLKFCLKVCQNKEMSEDVFANTYENLVRYNVKSGIDEEHLSASIKTVIVRRMIAAKNPNFISRVTTYVSDFDSIDSNYVDAALELTSRDAANIIAVAKSILPPKQFEAFLGILDDTPTKERSKSFNGNRAVALHKVREFLNNQYSKNMSFNTKENL